MPVAAFPPSTTSPAEVVPGEESSDGHSFFAFELYAVKGEVALSCRVAGEKRPPNPPFDVTGIATPKEYITRADLRLRGNRISESLGHGYGLLVRSTMHGFFIGEIDSGAHRFYDPHGPRGVCADRCTGV